MKYLEETKKIVQEFYHLYFFLHISKQRMRQMLYFKYSYGNGVEYYSFIVLGINISL